MKKIMIAVISLFLLITMVSIGGKNQMERKKWEALYQRGFLMLEEQIAYYITENYTGISKIEFSPILYRDGGGTSFSSAEVVPVIYDNYGNKAYLSHDVGNTTPVRHGLYSGLWALEFNYEGNPVIYISSDEGEMDVSDYEHLPEKAKMTKNEGLDDNIMLLIEDKQLKGIEKNKNGSLDAEVIYNTNIQKGDYMEWE